MTGVRKEDNSKINLAHKIYNKRRKKLTLQAVSQVLKGRNRRVPPLTVVIHGGSVGVPKG